MDIDRDLQTLDRLPSRVREFLSAAIEDEPGFLQEYVLPTLARPDAEEKFVDDLAYALAEVEVEGEVYGDDYETGDLRLGHLGKSFSKKFKKVVKSVASPIKKIAEKVHAPLKEVVKKAGSAIKDVGTKSGRIIHRGAKSGKLQLALAPFTAGVSLLFHPKVGAAGKKFMAGPYGNITIGAIGAILALATGGASLAIAAALTTANTMYQKKKEAEEAKRLAKADAGQLQAEADGLQVETERQLSEFYDQYAAYFQQNGVTRSMWDSMSTDEKIALLDRAASGGIPAPTQPPASEQQPPAPGSNWGLPPGTPGTPGWGIHADPARGGGGGGGGGGDGSGSSDPYLPGNRPPAAGGQPLAKASMGEFMMPIMIGVGIVAVIVQGKKKGRTRRNPGRRHWRVA